MRRMRRSDAARQEKLDRRLYRAAERGAVEAVKSAMADGAGLASAGALGTPLHACCAHGHLSAAMLLLEAGAPVNWLGDSSYTPLHLAARHGHAALVAALISYDADGNVQSRFERRTALHLAARRDEVQIAELLVLRRKAAVDPRDLYGNTPLHVAARLGHADLVELLLEQGASTDLYDNDGWSALHFAASEGHAHIVRRLVESKALIDQQNAYGRTPLHWACANGHLAAAEELLSAGASVDIKDRHGKVASQVVVGTHPALSDILRLYESNQARDNQDGDGHEVAPSKLDFQMQLKPFVRQVSRMAQRDDRRDEVDRRRSVTGGRGMTFHTAPDLAKMLTTMFGGDVVELIDGCFGQPSPLGRVERRTACRKYKAFLSDVGALMAITSENLGNLYNTVSAALQNNSQVETGEILKLIFEKLQSMEDSLADFQRLIATGVRTFSVGVSDIVDTCVQNESLSSQAQQTEQLAPGARASLLAPGRLLDALAARLAARPDTWRELARGLRPELDSASCEQLVSRIEEMTEDEQERATLLLYSWYTAAGAPADVDTELFIDLLQTRKLNDLADEVQPIVDRWRDTSSLLQTLVAPVTPSDSEIGTTSSISSASMKDMNDSEC